MTRCSVADGERVTTCGSEANPSLRAWTVNVPKGSWLTRSPSPPRLAKTCWRVWATPSPTTFTRTYCSPTGSQSGSI